MAEENQDHPDILAEEIFGALEKGESIFVRPKDEDALTRAIFANLDSPSGASQAVSDSAGLGELREEPKVEEAKIDSIRPKRWMGLARKRKEIIDSSISVPELGTFDARGLSDLERAIILRPLPGMKLDGEEASSKNRKIPDPKDVARAQDDWFSVRMADLSVREGDQWKRSSFSPIRKIMLAVLFVTFLVGGIWLGSSSNVLSGAFSIFEKKSFLNSSSFVLLNAQEDEKFPPLFLLYRNIKEKQDELIAQAGNNPALKSELLDAAEELSAMGKILEEFFETNQEFSWANMFAAIAPSFPQEESLVKNVISLKDVFEQEHDYIVEPATNDLKSYANWLEFWGDFLSKDGDYIIVVTNPEKMSPVAGEPYTYTQVAVRSGFLSIKNAGYVSELNSALTSKIIPPTPVQAVKTKFDFLETGWFLDSRTFAKAFSSLFEETTEKKIDGVAIVSYDLLKELSQKKDFSFNPDDVSWFRSILRSFERGAYDNLSSTERTLTNAFKNHSLSLYFIDPGLEEFVFKNDLLVETKNNQNEDVFSFGFRSWDEGKIRVASLDYTPEFFVDGSVVVEAKLNVSSEAEEATTVYTKLYVPYKSIVLGEEGFSAKQNIPPYNYSANGFSPNSYVSQILNYEGAENFSQLDFFREGDFLVIGGWVKLNPKVPKNISVKYRLPFRLDWQQGKDNYILKIIKPGGYQSLPFNYQLAAEPGVFVEGTDGKKIILKEDLILNKSIQFNNP